MSRCAAGGKLLALFGAIFAVAMHAWFRAVESPAQERPPALLAQAPLNPYVSGGQVAIFLHGFRKFDTGRGGATIKRVAGNTWDFSHLPGLYEHSYIVEYATDVPFESAVENVREVLRAANLSLDNCVLHTHSMGGLVAAALLRQDPGSSTPPPTPVAAFFYDSPFGGLNSSVESAMKAAIDAPPAPSSLLDIAVSLVRQPLLTAVQLWAPHYLERTRMTPGQIAFLRPLLSDDKDVMLRELRQSVIDLRERNGGHVHVIRWEHPAVLPTVPDSERASGDPAAVVTRRIPLWLKRVLAYAMPKYWFNTGTKHEGWSEWPWHSHHPPGEWAGTFIDHMSRHGGGQMFHHTSGGSWRPTAATAALIDGDPAAAVSTPADDEPYVVQVLRLSQLATRQREARVAATPGAAAAAVGGAGTSR